MFAPGTRGSDRSHQPPKGSGGRLTVALLHRQQRHSHYSPESSRRRNGHSYCDERGAKSLAHFAGIEKMFDKIDKPGFSVCEFAMFDLPYIITHPLLQRIMVQHAQLKEQAEVLPAGSAERKSLERRISRLEQYRLPKEDQRDIGQREDIFDASGQKIGERHSMRKRMIEKRRGRPEEFTIKTRAAFEEKLANPRKPWRVIATQFQFRNSDELRRAVRRLKEVLKREQIRIPKAEEYVSPANPKFF
jgi:hypothetical protein